ncbi:MAG: hypothetical protein IPO92_04760 [Saprospiraceae bacterium]|nr:hypothetical protein [Saprospiraceae bacterium]
MKELFVFLCFWLSPIIGFCQIPVLVKDHNVGAGDCGNISLHETRQIGDVIYYITEYGGRSYLNCLDKDGVRVLDTLCISNCGFNFIPKTFVFQDRLYYQRKVDDLNFTLKSVQTTQSSIKEVMRFNASIRKLYVDGNNTFYLFTANWSNGKDEYFSFNVQNQSLTKIFSGLTSDPQDYFELDNQLNYAYKSVDSLVLYKLTPTGIQINKKIKTPAGLEYSDMEIQNNDIIFSCQNQASQKAYLYRWDIGNNTIKKELEHMVIVPLSRPYFKKLSADSLVYHINTIGHLLIHNKPLLVDTLTRFAHENFEGSEQECFDQNGNDLFYLSIEKTGEISWTERLISYDLTSNTYKENLVEYTNFSSLIKHNNNLFFAGNISTGGLATLYRYNYKDKELKTIFHFDKTFSSKGIRPLGLIGTKLYFITKLDQAIGQELYSIVSGINTGIDETTTNTINLSNVRLVQRNGQYMILDYSTSDTYLIKVRLLSMEGKEIVQLNTDVNEFFELNIDTKGIYLLQVTNQKSQLIKTFKIQN